MVPARAREAVKALSELEMTHKASVECCNFCEDDVLETCILCCDDTFDRATVMCIADMLNSSPTWKTLASLRTPSRWRGAGLINAELRASGTAFTTGVPPERATFYIYERQHVELPH